ncbi:hypothetical protein RJ640_027137 [Escallonia rubra]|uniref:Uncharacterized protein n=1 Tax=Escallonia rubra TaxID=112253 RepID=A0AA88U0L7_9ASTE|nr:hypothetical protein RJ640_027137 [Escallonia rubra]
MAVAGGMTQNVCAAFAGMAHMGTRACIGADAINGDRTVEVLVTAPFGLMSTNSLLAGRLRFFFISSPSPSAAVVGIFSEPLTDMAMAGTVPVPVADIMAGSACSSSHLMVSPSDLWPSSRVSWKIRAAQAAGIRTLRPRPSTFVWRSLVDALLDCGGGGGAVTGTTLSSTSASSSLSFNTAIPFGVAAVADGFRGRASGSPPPPLFLWSTVLESMSSGSSCLLYPEAIERKPSREEGKSVNLTLSIFNCYGMFGYR